jgi:hypothetical protein
LPANAAGSLALLQKTSLIDHKDRVVISQRFECVVANNVPQIVGIPPASPQNGLLPPWARIAGCVCPHPARLPALIAKQTVEKKPSRGGNPLLREQRTHPRLHISQRLSPKLQRCLNRCACHPMTSESWWPMDSEPQEKCNCNASFGSNWSCPSLVTQSSVVKF